MIYNILRGVLFFFLRKALYLDYLFVIVIIAMQRVSLHSVLWASRSEEEKMHLCTGTPLLQGSVGLNLRLRTFLACPKQKVKGNCQ